MSRTMIFVSYSHRDVDWLRRLSDHVAVLERRGLLDVWSDTRLEAGADWEKEIEGALLRARAAVLLVSSAFLASKYIWEREMPRVIAHSMQGMRVLPLIIRPCAWRVEEALARFNARPTDGRPLSLGNESQVDNDLMLFTYELAALVGASPAAAAESKVTPPSKEQAAELPNIAGEWAGFYNSTRPVRLVIQRSGEELSGTMEYVEEGTITHVKGSMYSTWSADDPVWAQLGGADQGGRKVAVGFHETDYVKKGGSSISFDGHYRAFVSGDDMTGAWFSGHRLVGLLALERTKKASQRRVRAPEGPS